MRITIIFIFTICANLVMAQQSIAISGKGILELKLLDAKLIEISAFENWEDCIDEIKEKFGEPLTVEKSSPYGLTRTFVYEDFKLQYSSMVLGYPALWEMEISGNVKGKPILHMGKMNLFINADIRGITNLVDKNPNLKIKQYPSDKNSSGYNATMFGQHPSYYIELVISNNNISKINLWVHQD